MTISIPGIPDNKVASLCPRFKKRFEEVSTTWSLEKGEKSNISASGTLPDGKKVSTVTKFRIKDIPAPQGTVRKQSGSVTHT